MKKLIILLLLCSILFGSEMQAQQYTKRRYATRSRSRVESRSEQCRRCCSAGRFVDSKCQAECNCHYYNDEAKSTQKDYPQRNS